MMFDQYATLALSAAAPAHVKRSPVSVDESRLNPEASALTALHDFHRYPPATLPDRLCVEQAMELFRVLHLRYLLVENVHGDFQGILTADAVLGPRRMMLMRLHQMLPGEISVRELMIPRECLPSVPYAALKSARVGDVLHTLEVSAQRFLCVNDEGSPRHCQLRGLFCARDMGERLGLAWMPPLRARTFSELHATLQNQADLAG